MFMEKIRELTQSKMDWHLFWTALAVVVPIISTTIACFWSLSDKISTIDNRLTRIETVMIVKGIMPKELITINADIVPEGKGT